MVRKGTGEAWEDGEDKEAEDTDGARSLGKWHSLYVHNEFCQCLKNVYVFTWLFSVLRHAGALGAVCKLLVAACGIKFPDQGTNLDPLRGELGVLAAGPPEKSQRWHPRGGNKVTRCK